MEEKYIINDSKKVKKTVKRNRVKKEKSISNEVPEIREVVVEKKTGFNYAEVIVIMVITLILGGVIGSFITYIFKDNHNTSNTVVKEVPSELQEFIKTYNDIVANYYQEVDHDKLLEAGIKGMLEYLGDDYSFYMNTDESKSFNEQVEGKYEGIGVEIMLRDDNTVIISKVFNDTPASKAGLKTGDVFVSVNGESVTNLSPTEISNKIKGDSKTVKIVVNRDGKDLEFSLNLSEVELESVTSKVFEENGKKIGYIELSVFAANTYSQFEQKLTELESRNIDSLIIDVRDNSGGYLSTVTDIASLFLDKSKIIYQLDTKGIVEQVYAKTNSSRNYKIAVLINGNSASASEILAGALKESYGATIIGVNSFGKGTVQKAYQLESGATVKYTIQKWLTPNGNWINEVGITPDVKVELDNNYYKNPSDSTDNQLQMAIKNLSE